jgi:hypothetical protein
MAILSEGCPPGGMRQKPRTRPMFSPLQHAAGYSKDSALSSEVRHKPPLLRTVSFSDN